MKAKFEVGDIVEINQNRFGTKAWVQVNSLGRIVEKCEASLWWVGVRHGHHDKIQHLLFTTELLPATKEEIIKYTLDEMLDK